MSDTKATRAIKTEVETQLHVSDQYTDRERLKIVRRTWKMWRGGKHEVLSREERSFTRDEVAGALWPEA